MHASFIKSNRNVITSIMTSALCIFARVLLSGIVFRECGCGLDWPGLFWWKEQKGASCQWLSVLSIKGAMCPRQKGFLCPGAMQLWGLGTHPRPLLQSSLNGQNTVSYLCNVRLYFPYEPVLDVLIELPRLCRIETCQPTRISLLFLRGLWHRRLKCEIYFSFQRR